VLPVLLLLALGAVLASSLILHEVASRRARAIERREDDDRIHDVRLALKRMIPIVWICGALCGGLAYSFVLAYAADDFGWSSGYAHVAAGLACFAAAGVPVVVARRPFMLAYERIRDIPRGSTRSYRTAAAKMITLMTWLIMPVGAILAPISPTGRSLLVVASLVINPLLSGLLAPIVARLVAPSELPDGAGQALSALAQRSGVLIHGRLIQASQRRVANASQLGWLPGARFIMVTDYLLANLSPAEVEAVLAHELGHARRHDMLFRHLIAAVLIVPFGLAVLALESGTTGELLAVCAAFAVTFGVLRLVGVIAIRAEYAADEFACGLVTPTALADALDRLSALNQIKRDTSRSWDLHVGHPGMAQRMTRLKQRAAHDQNSATVD
jgi:STE24 endopeptidase